MQEFSSRIYEESARLIALIEDIIKLSRLDEGSALPNKQNVDLLGLSQQVCQRLLPRAAEGGVGVFVSGQPVCVQGVQQILEEMIYNLCDNAIKYNRPGAQSR